MMILTGVSACSEGAVRPAPGLDVEYDAEQEGVEDSDRHQRQDLVHNNRHRLLVVDQGAEGRKGHSQCKQA